MTVQKQVIVSGILLIIMFFTARFYVGRAFKQQLGTPHISQRPNNEHKVRPNTLRTQTPTKDLLSALTSASTTDPDALLTAIDAVSLPQLHGLPLEEKTRILQYLADTQKRIGQETPAAAKLHQALTGLERRLQQDWKTSIVITDRPPTASPPPALPLEEGDEPVEVSDEPE